MPNLIERLMIDSNESTRSYTQEGFLKVRGRVARTGIQRYYGVDLGIEEHPFLMFSIYRPPSVVYDSEFLERFCGLDVTNGHTKGGINANNFKDLTCGVVISNATREEGTEYIVCDLLIKDKDLIWQVESGKKEISLGYDSVIDMTPGELDSGEKYDGIVTAIPHVNHVAIVNKGRAGGARLLDSMGEKTMKIKVGTVEVELSDELGTAIDAEVQKINAQVQDQSARINDLNKQKAESDAQIERLKAELADAQSKVMTPEQLSQKIATLAKVREQAISIAGDDFVCDSVDEVEIKRQALSKAIVDREFADQAPEYINAFFDACLDQQAQTKQSHQNVSKALNDGLEPQKAQEGAYEKMKRETAEAWKQNN